MAALFGTHGAWGRVLGEDGPNFFFVPQDQARHKKPLHEFITPRPTLLRCAPHRCTSTRRTAPLLFAGALQIRAGGSEPRGVRGPARPAGVPPLSGRRGGRWQRRQLRQRHAAGSAEQRQRHKRQRRLRRTSGVRRGRGAGGCASRRAPGAGRHRDRFLRHPGAPRRPSAGCALPLPFHIFCLLCMVGSSLAHSRCVLPRRRTSRRRSCGPSSRTCAPSPGCACSVRRPTRPPRRRSGAACPRFPS